MPLQAPMEEGIKDVNQMVTYQLYQAGARERVLLR